MKILVAFLLILTFSSFAPADPEPFSFSLTIILAIAAGCYEVISRIIPTTKGWTIIGKTLEVLTWLSNLFDRKRK
jgi:hypothetical protein